MSGIVTAVMAVGATRPAADSELPSAIDRARVLARVG
jgi:hypothetical protein